MGLPDGLDTEVIIGYLMVFILSVIVLVYLGYDISWFVASSKKKKRGNKDAKEGKVSKVVGDGNEDGDEKEGVKKRGKVEAS